MGVSQAPRPRARSAVCMQVGTVPSRSFTLCHGARAPPPRPDDQFDNHGLPLQKKSGFRPQAGTLVAPGLRMLYRMCATASSNSQLPSGPSVRVYLYVTLPRSLALPVTRSMELSMVCPGTPLPTHPSWTPSPPVTGRPSRPTNHDFRSTMGNQPTQPTHATSEVQVRRRKILGFHDYRWPDPG